jgi:hypothetical protein
MSDTANGMMCPILTAAAPNGRLVGCYGEGCAFWNTKMQVCAIEALAQGVAYWMLNDSRDRMPRETQEMIHHRGKVAQ